MKENGIGVAESVSLPAASHGRRAQLTAALRAAGGGRVSDSFMVPVAQEAHTRQPYSTLTEMVAIRGKHQPCFLRVAEAPFDFLPFRQAADIRRGAWFTLGPGVVSGERSPMGWTGRIHPAVVLLQIEGSPDEVNLLAEPLFAVLTDFGVQVQIADCTDAAGWLCRCAAGVLPESQPADMIWRGQP